MPPIKFGEHPFSRVSPNFVGISISCLKLAPHQVRRASFFTGFSELRGDKHFLLKTCPPIKFGEHPFSRVSPNFVGISISCLKLAPPLKFGEHPFPKVSPSVSGISNSCLKLAPHQVWRESFFKGFSELRGNKHLLLKTRPHHVRKASFFKFFSELRGDKHFLL